MPRRSPANRGSNRSRASTICAATSGPKTNPPMNSTRRSVSGGARAVVADRVVVDTDVISFLFRGDTRAEAFRAVLADKLLLRRLEAFLTPFTLVLPDRELCRRWAMVVDGASRRGRPIQTADAWIAATA